MTEIETPRLRRRGHRRRRRRAARGDRGPRAGHARRRSSASRCSARRTPSWPRAASPPRWATSTPTTTGRCTSATPCAAASSSTTGGWPSCTPRRRRDRVWELETYGALFDRTKDGKISQRNFGGHEYPRLAHVGDRTGLELIRTLQQKIVSLQQDDAAASIGDLRGAGIKVFAECTITELLKRRAARSPARSATGASPAVRAVRGAGGGPGHRRHRQVVQGHVQLLGVHRRRPRAGAARRRDAAQHGVRPVPPDRHGLAAVGEGHPGHRVGARRRRGAEELRGQAVHVRLRPRRVPGAVRRQPRPRPTAGTPTPTTTGARRSCCPATRSPARSTPRSRPAAASPHGGVFLDIASPAAGRGDPAGGCRRCTTSSRSWPTSTSPPSRWRSARPATT